MDNGNKKSAGVQKGKSWVNGSTPFTPTDEQNETGYVKTEQVAKSIGVTK